MGASLAPVNMGTDHGGCPLIWIEGDGENATELSLHLATLLTAASDAGVK